MKVVWTAELFLKINNRSLNIKGLLNSKKYLEARKIGQLQLRLPLYSYNIEIYLVHIVNTALDLSNFLNQNLGLHLVAKALEVAHIDYMEVPALYLLVHPRIDNHPNLMLEYLETKRVATRYHRWCAHIIPEFSLPIVLLIVLAPINKRQHSNY